MQTTSISDPAAFVDLSKSPDTSSLTADAITLRALKRQQRRQKAELKAAALINSDKIAVVGKAVDENYEPKAKPRSKSKSKSKSRTKTKTKSVVGSKRKSPLRKVNSLTPRVRKVNSLRPSKETLVQKDERPVEDDAYQEEAAIDQPEAVEGLNIPKLDPSKTKTLQDTEITLTPLNATDALDVPRLSFDLQRVLFNPGVYHLQDPRSRVYNFDPYLEKIMPVTEFDFSALNEYVTSSEDSGLLGMAAQHNKKFVGSSSSMTGILSQFHFLLSAFRQLNFQNMSKNFRLESQNFTKLTMSPAAVFLRYRDGVYATDADKEFDEANILMSMGKSVEKLLTLEKDDFEKYRKSNVADDSGQEEQKPEQYHYSTIGNFLMRSQLDAYDHRLPGSGMFDLKTRAVAAIRMNLRDHESGQGYEIKGRYGTWESFEREYHDMMRSAFLKYSLQVRMGRMDGIFVAYHNIKRMFGFQYVSLAEMDYGLHGQFDTTLGDREFVFSVQMLEEVFKRATEKFPEQTLRFYFEVRPPTPKVEPVTYMNVFAEPVEEDDVERIQAHAQSKIEAFEKRVFGAEVDAEPTEAEEEDEVEDVVEEDEHINQEEHAVDAGLGSAGKLHSQEASVSSRIASIAADTSFLDSLANIEAQEEKVPSKAKEPFKKNLDNKPRVGYKIVVRHEVNGQYVGRPKELTPDDRWSIDYTIDEMPATQTRFKYSQCRARRQTALRMATTHTDGYFLSKLLRLSDNGRIWRTELDALDAQKRQMMLYEDGNKGRYMYNNKEAQE